MLPISIHMQSAKEVVRHFAFTLGGAGFLDRRRERAGLGTAHLTEATVEGRFASIYRNGIWKMAEDQASLSGSGSELAATAGVREGLARILADLGCKTLVDVGCGDWTWMRHVPLDCDYVGVDIVPEVIATNGVHATDRVRFLVLDAIRAPLPPADVVLCREVLFHLSFKDGLSVLRNICRSSTHLIATTDATWFNSDIRTGDFRMLNLRRRPFGLPAPLLSVPDDSVTPRRMLGVWSTDAVAGALAKTSASVSPTRPRAP